MLNARFNWALLLAACVIAGTATASAQQKLASLEANVNTAPGISVGTDRGGYVVSYGLRMMRWRQSGTKVRFTGSCESACTLYLGLSPRQTCISQGASFRFHAPFGSSRRGNRMAQAFMMRNYPAWVRSWLRSQGGLSSRLKTMNYAYASKFIKPCDSAVARRGAAKPRQPLDG
ncbi:MAG: hypothetical protein AB7F09_18805 [Parvibaculaceae bacterium]